MEFIHGERRSRYVFVLPLMTMGLTGTHRWTKYTLMVLRKVWVPEKRVVVMGISTTIWCSHSQHALRSRRVSQYALDRGCVSQHALGRSVYLPRGCVFQYAMGQTLPRGHTDRHLWKHNLRKIRLRAVNIGRFHLRHSHPPLQNNFLNIVVF